MTNQYVKNKSSWVRSTSLGMSAVFLYVNVVYGAIEPAKSFWQERKSSAEEILKKRSLDSQGDTSAKIPLPQKENTLLAQLPSLNLNFLNNQVPKLKGYGDSPYLPSSSLSQQAKDFKEKIVTKLPHEALRRWLKTVPMSAVHLKEIHVPPSWKPSDLMVVHIQDAHANYQAQENIAKMIESLAQTTNSEESLIIGIEGARGAFNFHPYRSFPDHEVTQEIAEHFLKESFITGPEYVGMTFSPSFQGKNDIPLRKKFEGREHTFPMFFWGVEDKDLYLQHVQAFKDAVPLENEAKRLHENISSTVQALKKNYFSEELSDLDSKMNQYHSGKIGLGEYLKFLSTKPASKLHSKTIKNFLSALSIEESLDYDKVKKERALLTQQLVRKLSKPEMKNLVSVSLSYRLGELSYGAFYQYLKDLCGAYGVRLRRWPEMEKYIRYVLISEKVRPEDLFKELKSLEDHRYQSLLKSSQGKNLVELSQDTSLIGKLVGFALSPAEWETYQSRKDRIYAIHQRIQKLAGEDFDEKIVTAKNDEMRRITRLIKSFEKFNESAIKRNGSLVKNLLKKSQENKDSVPYDPGRFAVLVAGGFHSEGITEILREKKIAYTVFAPRLGRIEGTGTEYLDFFRRDPTPLEKLFTGERINLASESIAVSESMAKISPSVFLVNRQFTLFAAGKFILKALREYAGLTKPIERQIRSQILTWLENTKSQGGFQTVENLTIEEIEEFRSNDGKRTIEKIVLTAVLHGKDGQGNQRDSRVALEILPQKSNVRSEVRDAKILPGASARAQVGPDSLTLYVPDRSFLENLSELVRQQVLTPLHSTGTGVLGKIRRVGATVLSGGKQILNRMDPKVLLDSLRGLFDDRGRHSKPMELSFSRGVIIIPSSWLDWLRGKGILGKWVAEFVEDFVAPYLEEILFTAVAVSLLGFPGLVVSRLLFVSFHLAGKKLSDNKYLNVALKLAFPVLISIIPFYIDPSAISFLLPVIPGLEALSGWIGPENALVTALFMVVHSVANIVVGAANYYLKKAGIEIEFGKGVLHITFRRLWSRFRNLPRSPIFINGASIMISDNLSAVSNKWKDEPADLRPVSPSKEYINFEALIASRPLGFKKGQHFDLAFYPERYGKHAIYYLLRDLDQLGYRVNPRGKTISLLEGGVGIQNAHHILNKKLGKDIYEKVRLQPDEFFETLSLIHRARVRDGIDHYAEIDGMVRLARDLSVARAGEDVNLSSFYDTFGSKGGQLALNQVFLADSVDFKWSAIAMPYRRLMIASREIAREPDRYVGISGMLRLAKWLADQGEVTGTSDLFYAFGKDRGVAVVGELAGTSLAIGDLEWHHVRASYKSVEDLALRAEEGTLDDRTALAELKDLTRTGEFIPGLRILSRLARAKERNRSKIEGRLADIERDGERLFKDSHIGLILKLSGNKLKERFGIFSYLFNLQKESRYRMERRLHRSTRIQIKRLEGYDYLFESESVNRFVFNGYHISRIFRSSKSNGDIKRVIEYLLDKGFESGYSIARIIFTKRSVAEIERIINYLFKIGITDEYSITKIIEGHMTLDQIRKLREAVEEVGSERIIKEYGLNDQGQLEFYRAVFDGEVENMRLINLYLLMPRNVREAASWIMLHVGYSEADVLTRVGIDQRSKFLTVDDNRFPAGQYRTYSGFFEFVRELKKRHILNSQFNEVRYLSSIPLSVRERMRWHYTPFRSSLSVPLGGGENKNFTLESVLTEDDGRKEVQDVEDRMSLDRVNVILGEGDYERMLHLADQPSLSDEEQAEYENLLRRVREGLDVDLPEENVGGVIQSLKIPLVKLAFKLAKGQYSEDKIGKAYDLVIAPWLENVLVWAAIAILTVSGMDFGEASLTVWKIFFEIHVLEYAVLTMIGSPRAPPFGNMIAAGIISFFNIGFSFFPLNPISIGLHFLVNLIARWLTSMSWSLKDETLSDKIKSRIVTTLTAIMAFIGTLYWGIGFPLGIVAAGILIKKFDIKAMLIIIIGTFLLGPGFPLGIGLFRLFMEKFKDSWSDSVDKSPGGIIQTLKIPTVAALSKLLGRWITEWKISKIYDLIGAPGLENLLVHGVSLILMSSGMDFAQANLISWGGFFVVHVIEFVIYHWIGSPRAPPLGNVVASGVIAFVNVVFGLSPLSFLSIGFHFLVNVIGSLIKRSVPWLPSEQDLLDIARSENAVVYTNVTSFHPFIRLLESLSPGSWWKMGGDGSHISIKHLLDGLVDEAELPASEIRIRLRLPDWARSLVLVNSITRSPRQVVLMEEVFHVLEGDALSDEWWGRVSAEDKHVTRIREKFNDFLQLMFYPRNKVHRSNRHYTDWWSDQERLALLNHYRDNPGRDPNVQLRDIIEAVFRDVRDDVSIPVRNLNVPIGELLAGPGVYKSGQYGHWLEGYLKVLLKTERFRNHSPLFPNWKLRTSQKEPKISPDTRRPTSILHEPLKDTRFAQRFPRVYRFYTTVLAPIWEEGLFRTLPLAWVGATFQTVLELDPTGLAVIAGVSIGLFAAVHIIVRWIVRAYKRNQVFRKGDLVDFFKYLVPGTLFTFTYLAAFQLSINLVSINLEISVPLSHLVATLSSTVIHEIYNILVLDKRLTRWLRWLPVASIGDDKQFVSDMRNLLWDILEGVSQDSVADAIADFHAFKEELSRDPEILHMTARQIVIRYKYRSRHFAQLFEAFWTLNLRSKNGNYGEVIEPLQIVDALLAMAQHVNRPVGILKGVYVAAMMVISWGILVGILYFAISAISPKPGLFLNVVKFLIIVFLSGLVLLTLGALAKEFITAFKSEYATKSPSKENKSAHEKSDENEPAESGSVSLSGVQERLARPESVPEGSIAGMIQKHFGDLEEISFADLDSGTGEFVTSFRELLENLFREVHVIGMESFQVWTDQAVARGHRVVHANPQIPGEYEQAGLTDHSRDIVTINAPESAPEALIAQADRILEPSGLLIITFELYDILQGPRVDKTIEQDLKKRGYIVRQVPLPEDYPRSATFEQADFALLAWKSEPLLGELRQHLDVSQGDEGSGGIIQVLKIPFVAVFSKLLGRWFTREQISGFYDLVGAPGLENPLVWVVSAALMATGLSFEQANLISWGSFFVVHVLEYAILRLVGSPRAPPFGNVIASGFISVLNVGFGLSPLSPYSFGLHFAVNLFGRINSKLNSVIGQSITGSRASLTIKVIASLASYGILTFVLYQIIPRSFEVPVIDRFLKGGSSVMETVNRESWERYLNSESFGGDFRIISPQEMDSMGSRSWEKYLNYEALLGAWSPPEGSPYSKYVKTKTMRSIDANKHRIEPRYSNGERNSVDEIENLIFDSHLGKDVGVILDTGGAHSVAMAIRLMKEGYQPIVMFDSFPRTLGAVAVEQGLATLLYFAEEAKKLKEEGRFNGESPPVFILDTHRDDYIPLFSRNNIDNTYRYSQNDFPTGRRLRRFNIDKVIYVSELGNQKGEINPDFQSIDRIVADDIELIVRKWEPLGVEMLYTSVEPWPYDPEEHGVLLDDKYLGGILQILKIPFVALFTKLLGRWFTRGQISKFYDLVGAPGLENPLVWVVSAALMATGLSFEQANLISWGSFFVVHVLEYAILRLVGSPRAPPFGNVIASGFISVLNVGFGLSPLSPYSFGLHFAVNLVAPMVTSIVARVRWISWLLFRQRAFRTIPKDIPKNVKKELKQVFPMVRPAGLGQSLERYRRVERSLQTVASDKQGQILRLIKIVMLSEILGFESDERKSRVTERIGSRDLTQLSRVIGYMSQEEMGRIVSAFRQLHGEDREGMESSFGAFAQELFESGGRLEESASRVSSETRAVDFGDTFEAYLAFRAIVTGEELESDRIWEHQKAARSSWEQGKKRVKELSDPRLLKEVSDLPGFKKDSVQAETAVASAFDFSDVFEPIVSANKINLLVRQIVSASQSEEGLVVVPLITNQNVSGWRFSGKVKKLLGVEMESRGYSTEEVRAMFAKVSFGKVVITGKDLRKEQVVDPRIEMDTDLVYRMLKEKVSNLTGVGNISVQLFTDNIHRFKENWVVAKLRMMIIASANQVIVATRDTAESLREIAVFNVQQ